MSDRKGTKAKGTARATGPGEAGRLQEALAARDAALLELAQEKERTNALRLWARAAGEVDPVRYPGEVGPDGAPLRYVVADRLNDGFKRLLGPLHERGKALLGGAGKKERDS
jgi:hypothetical protein